MRQSRDFAPLFAAKRHLKKSKTIKTTAAKPQSPFFAAKRQLIKIEKEKKKMRRSRKKNPFAAARQFLFSVLCLRGAAARRTWDSRAAGGNGGRGWPTAGQFCATRSGFNDLSVRVYIFQIPNQHKFEKHLCINAFLSFCAVIFFR